MITVSAFADEISEDLEEQVNVLKIEGIRHVELRSVWGTNVLELSDSEVDDIRKTLNGNGMRVSTIASPLGKVPVDTPIEEELERLSRALWLCDTFDAPVIRIFSYYPTDSQEAHSSGYRNEVLKTLNALVRVAAKHSVTLLHENDIDLYGDTIARCTDILDAIPDPHLAAVLDPANYLLAGETPYPDGYEAIKDRLRMVHVKDARGGKVVTAGEGDGHFPELVRRLKEDDFNGILALEPHLRSGGKLRGFSGPNLFQHAAHALKSVLDDAGLTWA